MESPTPAQNEAEAVETVTVDYADESYCFPAALEDVDGDVVDALDDQKLSHALRGLMGPDEWKRFKATKPKARDYAGLCDAWAAATGLSSAGN